MHAGFSHHAQRMHSVPLIAPIVNACLGLGEIMEFRLHRRTVILVCCSGFLFETELNYNYVKRFATKHKVSMARMSR